MIDMRPFINKCRMVLPPHRFREVEQYYYGSGKDEEKTLLYIGLFVGRRFVESIKNFKVEDLNGKDHS